MHARLLAPAIALLVTGALLPAGAASATPAPDTGHGVVNPMIVDGKHAATARGVVFVTRTDGKATCTGSLIKASWVLTAKHCIDGANSASKYKIRANSVDREKFGDVRFGDFRILNSNVDIGLLHLDRPVTHGPFMTLATQNPKIGGINKVKGWGCTEDRADKDCPVSRRLKSAQVSVAAFKDGKRVIHSDRETGQACYGDSGGPQMRLDNGHQNGVISGVSKQCNNLWFSPEVSSISVPTHLPWIRTYVPGV